ncbi:transcriptional regulator, TetR family [Hespellia stercorisuis DSM 15480]|uniref:Transcriptional regulator, TetR family n=1 Tax=Hespellia stercorisuis DSM 15480 TaxID=1121950 RepID=A0A1M6V0I7_9FIRM|nr:TetR/AcrR family transcriptional regulator [Hespellia stercorisuis]SHK74950.1 transcriptional regulator, TetR family [Hespellia stercorisuis DSM 15480]
MSNITKKQLEEALKQCLLQKPFDKITISDLTEACGISRMTFYYHFKDIYDLVEYSCEEDGKKALQNLIIKETKQ